jgi:glycosyltransferase involved in cell wall biosynthesis
LKINFFAPLNFHLGYGIHGTGLAEALLKSGVDLNYIPTEGIDPKDPNFKHFDLLPHAVNNSTDMDRIGVNLSVGNLMNRFCGKTRIGYTLLEVDKLPEDWVSTLNQLDAVWTPTHWGKDTFIDSGVKEDLMAVVPEGVNVDVFNPYAYPIDGLVARDTFKFLCVGKLENRKNIDDLCIAFSRAFQNTEKVELFLMIDNPFVKGNVFEYLYNLNLPVHAPIVPLQSVPEHNVLANIMVSCDAFVLPSRAEGWGLPFLEAMACGLPAIGTDWSGNTEFMNKNNSYLVKVKELIQAEDPIFGHYLKQGRWAKPSIAHLVELMRYIFDNQEEARKKGQKAAMEVAEKWSWEQAAKKARKELEKHE